MRPPIEDRLSVTLTSTVPSTDKPARHLPGEAGIWLFIFGDMMMFSLFFIIFLFYRGQDVDLFQTSQARLNQGFGVLNTVFMLSSSWCVATAVHTARKNWSRVSASCFALGFLCGLGFVVVKVLEYAEKIRSDITLTTNDFYMYYYMFTGIHLMHVLVGLGVLAFMTRYAWSGGFDAQKVSILESGASFWHVVDLLWIVLFALIYLLR